MSQDLSIFYGCIILYLSNTLCSSGGVGGGSLNVPIFYSIMGLDYDVATVLSLCNLMGNYLLQVLINLDKRHPSLFVQSRPLIYWDAVLILLPSELGGANIGTLINIVMPDAGIYLLGMIVLIIASIFTFKKALYLYKNETILLTSNLSDNDNTVSLLHDDKFENNNVNNNNDDNNNNNDVMNHNLTTKHTTRLYNKQDDKKKITITSIIPPYLYCYYKKVYTSEELSLPPIIIPWTNVTIIFIVWVLYVICYVVLNLFNQCSINYYISLLAIYIVLFFQVIWGIRYLNWKQKTDKDIIIVDGDLNWDKSTLFMPFISFLVGIICTLLGIGGGELMGPLLLYMKVLSPVSSATTSFMSLLNSSSSVAHHIVLGDLPYPLGSIVFIIGALGGFTGRVLALYFVAIYHRASILIFTLGCVIGLSFFIYLFYLVSGDFDFSFGVFC